MKNLLLISILVFSAACGKKSSSSKKVAQFFVKGDPLTLVKGTEKNKVSFLTTENIDSFNNFALTNLYIFAEKELISNEERENIEEGNEAEETDQTKDDAIILNVKKINDSKYLLASDNTKINFGFKRTGNLLELNSVLIGDTKFVATIEHYSLSPDKSKMSFLFRVNTQEDGNVLVSAAFYRYSAKQPISKVSSQYRYIYGPGVVVPWKLDATRKITVDVCPSLTSQLTLSEIKKALEAWEAPFKNKLQKLDIVPKAVVACKPFSDVNQHSIHFIDSYLTMQEQDAYNPGFAMIHADVSVGNIFDADIVILGSEIGKDTNFDAMEFGRVISHEFGHFLGLDHQFEGPTSIMSYKSIYELGEYDNNAITNLYK